MTVAAADAKFKKLVKDNGTLCAKYCGASRVRKDSANDHMLNVLSALWNDSLIFALMLLIILFMLYFVMCAFDDNNIQVFWVVSGLIPYYML